MQRPAVNLGNGLERVWPKPSAAVQQEVSHFWSAEGGLTRAGDAEERSKQLIVVARDKNGHVAGVSTAARIYAPLLGFHCFYYRTFVGKRHRSLFLNASHMVMQITLESYQLLNERFLAGHDSGVLGLYAEIDNPGLMRLCNEVVWGEYGMNFVYIGRTETGRHIRVWYFEGARIP